MPTITHYDLCVIGGGINGVGIANDAAGRGLSVVLCEQNDLASGTSCWSSKLIHGGLRYLENYEFGLVRNALKEQKILIKKAPHLIRPLPFVLPHEPDLRPAWVLRAGLILYDLLGYPSVTPKSQCIRLSNPALLQKFKTGYQYYDAMTDDARLVVINAIQAKQKGAVILTHTQCTQAYPHQGYWAIDCLDKKKNQIHQIQAKVLVNAGGPWVDFINSNTITASKKPPATCQLVQGSHIVVPKLYEEDHAYILQNTDKRIVFTIPYQTNYTLIGTTDKAYNGDPAQASICPDETEYLCDIIQHYFQKRLIDNEIIWHFSGVRALYNNHADNLSKTTRDHHIELTDENGKTPLLTLVGGKLTTYRAVADEVIRRLAPFFPKMGPAWTATSPLPGGDLPCDTLEEFQQIIAHQYPWLTTEMRQRYVFSYGTLLHDILSDCHSIRDLGLHFGHTLYAKEVDYLLWNEFVSDTDDILWRRSKFGLFLNSQQQETLTQYLNDK